jgi:predicted N-acetyltransferase YhbS
MIVIEGFDASQVLVRTMAEEDAASVAGLSGQLGYEVSIADAQERIRYIRSHVETQVAFVACLGQQLVGWIEASTVHHLQSPTHTLIGGLVVREGVRSLGIGRSLCHEVEQWSLAMGIPIIRVTSRSTRKDAHRFYLRDGYQQTKLSAVFEKVLSPDRP